MAALPPIEFTHVLAVVLALGAALSIAISNLYVRVGTQDGKATHAVFIVTGINVLVVLPIAALVYYPDYQLTYISVASFLGAGIFGTLLGRAFLYMSIDRIGASRTAPIVTSQAIVATVLGVVILGERLSVLHALGVVFIVGGVAYIAWVTSRENPDDLSRRKLLIGLLLPIGAAIAYGWEPLFAKAGFAEGTPAIVGVTIKIVATILGLTLYLWWQDELPSGRILRSENSRYFLIAGLANTGFLLGYYLSLELAPVSIVLPLIKTDTLFILLLSVLFMPKRLERVTWKLAVAATIAVLGVVLVAVFG